VEIAVEIDSGHHRTALLRSAPARRRGCAAAAHRHGLGMAGVFTFPGHSYEPGRRE
jgi:D-serine deaminase-like pyridoxal phosphate-dependent protein